MSSKFWYYPNGMTNGAEVVEVDLSGTISSLEEIPEWSGSEQQTVSGKVYTQQRGGALRVRLSFERFDSASIMRRLLSMESHLNRGGTVGFAADHTKAYAGYVPYGMPWDTTALGTNGNTWDYGQAAVTLASGDEMVIAAPAPLAIREWRTIGTFTSRRYLTLQSGLVYDYSTADYLLVRHRDYFPALRRVPGDRSPIVTTEHRVAHTLQLELVEDWTAIAAFSRFEEGIMRGDADGDQGITLEESSFTMPIRNRFGV